MGLSELKIKRLRNANESMDLNISEWKCCKGKRCFTRVNQVYFKAQRKRFFEMTQAQRKLSLISMLRLVDTNNITKQRYFFDGLQVCARFLEVGFGMSRFLQCAVKETPKSSGSKSIIRMPILGAKQTARDSIRSFLENLAECTANKMPDCSQLHLPYFEKKHVYERFKMQWREQDGTGNILAVPTYAYFITVWQSYCQDIKCRRVHRFSKCDVCEQLRQQLADAGMDRLKTDALRELQKKHHQFVEKERLQYYKNRELARKLPKKFASIIIDGASQSAYGLPHWPYETKATQRGHKIGVHLTGILEHASPNNLTLLTMTDEHKTGANHVIEALHRWISRKEMEGRLPDVLFVQVDNCTRENKNRYFFSYIECLVALEVFSEIQVSFLPVGHTHEDIDQSFSCTSKRLKTHSAVTLQDLIHELSCSYTPQPHVSHMLHVINLSSLFEQSQCLANVPPFSHFRYFRFSKEAGEPRSRYERSRTTVSVKESCQLEWNYLHSDKSGGFLKFTPDIFSAPPTFTTPPENFLEVRRGILSAESRIASKVKMDELEKLFDMIYKPRKDPMHWSKSSSPESVLKLQCSSKRDGMIRTEDSDTEEESVIDYSYSIGDMIAIRTDDESCPFWLASVDGVIANGDGLIHRLKIVWLEAYGNKKDPHLSKYRRAILSNNKEWTAEISSNTVLARLTKLRRDNRLSTDDSKRIKESLSTCL